MPRPKRYFDPASSEAGGDEGGPASKRRNFTKSKSDKAGEPEGPVKEKWKAKEGFISGGLKIYSTAQGKDDDVEGDAARKAEIAEGWKSRSSTQSTLYISNLPRWLTSPQLEGLMSSFAPLRSAFVVSSAGAGADEAPKPTMTGPNALSAKRGADRTGKSESRGFGYARFVLATDATACLAAWEKGIPASVLAEVQLDGAPADRGELGKVRLGWAKKKLKEGEAPEAAAGADAASPAKKRKTVAASTGEEKEKKGPIDRNASCTVIVTGLPYVARAGKGAVDDAMTEEEPEAEQEDDDNAPDEEVPAGDDDDAAEGEEEAGPEGSSKAATVDWAKVLRQRSRKLLSPADSVWLSSLYGLPCAYLLLPSPRDAQNLAKRLHNHVLKGELLAACVKSSWELVDRHRDRGGRVMVRNLDFDLTMEDLRAAVAPYGALHSINLPMSAKEPSQNRGFAFVHYLIHAAAEKALAGLNGTRLFPGLAKERIEKEGGKGGKKSEVRKKEKEREKSGGGGGGERGRIVAVDWALEKKDWEKVAPAVEADGAASAGSETESGSSDEEDDSGDENEDDDSPVPDDLAQPQTEQRNGEEEDEEPTKPKEETGVTLFVRNLSFEATEAELYDLFKSFGPIRYARIVYDPATKRSRGTAFVHFWKEEDAQAVLEASSALNNGNFASTSLLTMDPSASSAARLTLHGRVLAAVQAVSKDRAESLRSQRDKEGKNQGDRRNLYLMQEGVIFASSPRAGSLHPTDLQARQTSYSSRRALLRSNPSLYISRVRLSVRQVPLYVSDGMLKRLANHAIKTFDKEVKAGTRPALAPDELALLTDIGGPLPAQERVKGVPPSKVRQAKILRQTDRVDPLTGMGRSKGYGFLELGKHEDALKVVRWCTEVAGMRAIGGLLRGWWSEALEKMIEKEKATAATAPRGGKHTTELTHKERLARLEEKMAELVEEERVAHKKGASADDSHKVSRSQKSLIVEFSIENAQTTKRRSEKVEKARATAARRRAREEEAAEGDAPTFDNSEPLENGKARSKGGKRGAPTEAKPVRGKKRPASTETDSLSGKKVKKEVEKPEEAPGEKEKRLSVGQMIGKKRKMRKGK